MKKKYWLAGLLTALLVAFFLVLYPQSPLNYHRLVNLPVGCPNQPPSDSPWMCFSFNNYGRGVMYLPIRFDGGNQEYLLQVDIGAPVSALDEVPLKQINQKLESPVQETEPTSKHDFVSVNGWLGSARLEDARFALYRSYGDRLNRFGYSVIGSLGMDYFKDKVVILDFSRQWIAFIERPERIPSQLEEQIHWVDARLEDNKFIFPITIGGERQEVFYDTGGGRYPLDTTKEIWKRLTGRQGSEQSNVVIEAKSFGKPVTYIGAPLLERVEVARIPIGNPLVFYNTDPYEWLDMSAYPVPISAGNHLFIDQFTLIFDLVNMRFGLTNSPVSLAGTDYLAFFKTANVTGSNQVLLEFGASIPNGNYDLDVPLNAAWQVTNAHNELVAEGFVGLIQPEPGDYTTEKLLDRWQGDLPPGRYRVRWGAESYGFALDSFEVSSHDGRTVIQNEKRIRYSKGS